MSFAHITHGLSVTNTTLSFIAPGAFTRAFISEWMQPQLPGTAESHMLGKPFALLLPLTTLETRTRQQLFQRYGLEIVLFDRRINFHVPSGKESKSWFATAWFTWGLDIGKELNFVSLVESQQQVMELA